MNKISKNISNVCIDCGLAASTLSFKEFKRAIAAHTAAQVAEAYKNGQINILERVYCCDNRPVNDKEPLNVCSEHHTDLLAQLNPPNQSKQGSE